jgi:hypothetical protein
MSSSIGTVIHFKPDKGYGFITPDGGGAGDLVVHINNCATRSKHCIAPITIGWASYLQSASDRAMTREAEARVCWLFKSQRKAKLYHTSSPKGVVGWWVFT